MQDRMYLLDLAELTDGERSFPLFQRAQGMVDAKRLEKVMRIRSRAAQAASLGAGLLIQKAVAERELPAAFFRRLGVGELLAELEGAAISASLVYEYGEHGKPYLKDIPLQFNLSHSGGFVLCAVSEREVGADIQQMRKLSDFKVAERYFSPAEIEKIKGGGDYGLQAAAFYELWTRKEAYGKLIGEGIAASVGRDMEELFGEVDWLECEPPEGYKIAICKAKGGNER